MRNLNRFESAQGDQLTVHNLGYDWRPAIQNVSSMFRSKLLAILRQYDQSSSDVYFLAHSMGGLVLRTLIESGDELDGWLGRIKACIFVATPHFGAPQAAAITIGWCGAQGMNASTVKAAVDLGILESVVGLIPPASLPFVQSWAGDQFVRNQNVDFIKVLTDAITDERTAHWPILLAGRRPEHCQYFCVGNANVPTVCSLSYHGNTLDLVETVRFGDGTVPIFSAFLPTAFNVKANGNHMDITGSRKAMDVVRNALGLSHRYEAMALGKDVDAIMSVSSTNPRAKERVSIDVWPEDEVGLRVRVYRDHEPRGQMLVDAAVGDSEHTYFELLIERPGWYAAELTRNDEVVSRERFFFSR
ncbi:MAG: hypothetical protein MRY64_03830 [Hyphomonadaceae bacterium]|nr:hypothetical protein [Hyphomonadaceae bacterium]